MPDMLDITVIITTMPNDNPPPFPFPSPVFSSVVNSGQVNKSNEAAVAVEKELEKRELDEVFPGKKASRTVTRRDDWKNKQNARKRNKIRCLAKVESLDWATREGEKMWRKGRQISFGDILTVNAIRECCLYRN